MRTQIIPLKIAWLAVTILMPLLSCTTNPDQIKPSATSVSSPTPSVAPSRTSTQTTVSATPTTTRPPTTLPPSSTPSPLALLYYFPVQPSDAATFGSEHSGYPATDIFAPEGALFVAVTSGTVDFVRDYDPWDPADDDPATRGGLAVAIIGDDGVRYYGSHLSSIAPGIVQGARVYAGQLLGTVGKSGNARHTPPHLHFGISHPTFARDWEVRRGEIAPYPYLLAWLNGELLAPVLP